ncbi:YccF domain-containing protein [Phreatobacter cathodiphilus]|uniref:YccF domain-containing protein n=1 Tax=Phreatobacter cathodiphilus TaxID=1868589 RepID=UPI001C071E66|nr:YccF domain-containing protein [Phreatobacter cathodiphilus]
MGPIRLILNILWFVLGGLIAGLAWFVAGAIAAITIIGLPWAFACFRIGSYTLWPFGRDVVWASELTGRPSGAMGVLRFLGNVIWFVPIGFTLMVIHVAAALACFVTIVGIPFGWAHLKLAAASVFPLGQRVVASDVADLARRQSASTALAGWRR